jgi:hypothetical protein
MVNIASYWEKEDNPACFTQEKSLATFHKCQKVGGWGELFYYLFKNEINDFLLITWASCYYTLLVFINQSIDEKNELIL